MGEGPWELLGAASPPGAPVAWRGFSGILPREDQVRALLPQGDEGVGPAGVRKEVTRGQRVRAQALEATGWTEGAGGPSQVRCGPKVPPRQHLALVGASAGSRLA